MYVYGDYPEYKSWTTAVFIYKGVFRETKETQKHQNFFIGKSESPRISLNP